MRCDGGYSTTRKDLVMSLRMAAVLVALAVGALVGSGARALADHVRYGVYDDRGACEAAGWTPPRTRDGPAMNADRSQLAAGTVLGELTEPGAPGSGVFTKFSRSTRDSGTQIGSPRSPGPGFYRRSAAPVRHRRLRADPGLVRSIPLNAPDVCGRRGGRVDGARRPPLRHPRPAATGNRTPRSVRHRLPQPKWSDLLVIDALSARC